MESNATGMSIAALVSYGLLGGVALEALHWYMLARRPEEVETFRRKPLYWITTIIMVLLGAITPLLYTVDNALLAFQLGLTSPLLLQKLAGAIPNIAVQQGSSLQPDGSRSVNIQRFFSW